MGIIKGLVAYIVKAPLSGLYGIGVYVRNKFYDWGLFKSTRFDFPIINIGNITVGGTGKTPHVEFILNLLSNKYKAAMLSRGYKRKSKGFQYVNESDSVKNSGDEPLQVKQKYPQTIVAVDANRVRGITKLKKDNNIQVVVLDDAFQHRKVNTEFNILLIDYNRPIHTDHLLPWGRLRDSKSQIKRAEIVIITKCPNDLQPVDLRMISKYADLKPYQQLFFTSLEYGEKEPVFPNIEFTTTLKDKGFLSVVGIASPNVFLNYVENNFGETTSLVFPDHHNFTKSDIQKICKKAQNVALILTTEKDKTRLLQWENIIPDEIKSKFFYIPIKITFLKDEDKFTKIIYEYVKTNKGNSRLY